MKKTFTINISGAVFHIEEDAYEVLYQYLMKLKSHFGSNEEGREILSDIEARIAEIFNEKADGEKRVITLEMVNEVIEIMGTPEDFAEEAGEDEEVYQETSRKRRLYRDPENRVAGGVCAGLAAYFDFDPVIVRIIFVVLFFATSGAALPVYLILWIAVPKAVSTAQRLEMHGREANVRNIEKTIKEEVKEVQESVRRLKQSDAYSKGKKSMEDVGDVFLRILKVALKVAVVALGAFLILFGFLGFLGLTSSLIIGQSFVQGLPMLWGEVYVPDMLNHFVEPGVVSWGMLLVGVIAGLPLIALIFVGTKLVFRYKSNNGLIALSMISVWFVALVALIVLSVSQVGHYRDRTSITTTETIDCGGCNTLYLKLAEDKMDEYAELDFDVDGFEVRVVDGNEVVMGYPKLDVERATSNNFVISVKRSSRGKSREEARRWCEEVEYHYQVNDSLVEFDPYFFLGERAKWRAQQVRITVKVPVGKSVFLSEDLIEVIDDIENTTNTWDGDMVGKFWEMKPEGLTLRSLESSESKDKMELEN